MNIITTNVRDIKMKLMGFNRSLELCARMNYETEILDFIDLINPGDTLFDLGACEGRFSIYASLKGIKCYSFEPEKNNYDVLLRNISLNFCDYELLKPFKLAVGDTNGFATLAIGQPWAGGHQKVIKTEIARTDLAFDFVDHEIVPTVSLDFFLVEQKISCPNYLKVDIDGSEMLFIKGAEKTLSSTELKSIVFELNIKDHNFKTIVSKLNNCGLFEVSRHSVPNEAYLYNIIFTR